MSQFLVVNYLKIIATVQHAYRVEFCLLSISEWLFIIIFSKVQVPLAPNLVQRLRHLHLSHMWFLILPPHHVLN